MKQKIAFFILTLLCIGCTKDPQIQAAYDLIERVTPGYGQQFKLELIEPVNGEDAYEIASIARQNVRDQPGKHVLLHL